MNQYDSQTSMLEAERPAAASSGRLAVRAIRTLGLGLGLMVLGVGLLYANWAAVEHRLTVVAPGRVYQSAEMPPEDLVRLAGRLGIQTVFDFRDDTDGDPRIVAERVALEEHDIKYEHLPSARRPSLQAVAAFVHAMQAEVAARRTVLLHCHDGEGRAVFFSAVYRMEFEGWDNERAYNGTTRLPPYLMFVNKLFPSVGRLSSSNPKTPLIRDYRRLASVELPPLAGGP